MISDNLMTISMFSKMTQISRKNLIYYDSIDLLKPEKYGENGYRYYSFKQVELSYIIITLRSLNVPLNEIRDYLKNRSPELGLNLFKEQLQKLNERIAHMHEMKNYIQYQIEVTSEGFDVLFNVPTIQSQEQALFIVSDFNITFESSFSSPLVGDFFDKITENGLISNYNVGLFYQENRSSKKRDFFLAIRSTTFNKKMRQVIKPKGSYLTVCHEGSPERFDEYIDRLKGYAMDHNIQLKDHYFYEYIWDEIVTADRSAQICKISVEIVES